MAKTIRGGEGLSRQFDEHVRRQRKGQQAYDAETEARQKQYQHQGGRAMRRMGAILRGQPPSRDPNWDPQ